MFISVNYIAVLIATIVCMIIGGLWYGPVFGKKWKELEGFTDEAMKSMPLTGGQAMGLGFIAALISNYVLAQVLGLLAVNTVGGAMQIAFLLWLGFHFTTLSGVWLWEGKSYKLWLFNAAQYLLALLVAAAIIVSL